MTVTDLHYITVQSWPESQDPPMPGERAYHCSCGELLGEWQDGYRDDDIQAAYDDHLTFIDNENCEDCD